MTTPAGRFRLERTDGPFIYAIFKKFSAIAANCPALLTGIAEELRNLACAAFRSVVMGMTEKTDEAGKYLQVLDLCGS